MKSKPSPRKQVKITTKKVYDKPVMIATKKLDTSVPSKEDIAKKVKTKMVENSYDMGILRYNRGGQPNPTPSPRIEAKKKPTMVSKVVSKLKKK